MTLKRGDVLAGDQFEDEYMVVHVERRSVVAVDLTYNHCLRWWLASDGIRVGVYVVPYQEGVVEPTEMIREPLAITVYSPPKRVEEHLRPTVQSAS